MDILLNLLWLLLVMPAFWVWRRQDRSLGSLRCLLVLACGVVLLFPAVSATDDLQAMRPERVESSLPKRALRQRTIEKGSGQNQCPKSPAILTFISAVRPCVQCCGQPRVQPHSSCVSACRPGFSHSVRPPSPFLASESRCNQRGELTLDSKTATPRGPKLPRGGWSREHDLEAGSED